MMPPRLRERRSTLVLLATVLVLAATVRMPFWLSYTYAYGHGDAIIWEVWSRAIFEHGFINVLRTADSNNIGYHYVLWPTSIVYGRISPEYELWTPAIRILIKVPPFLSDLAIAALIFFIARSFSTAATQLRRDASAAVAACAFALAPAIIYDSMWWSQIESVTTLCMMGALVLTVRGNAGWGWAIGTVGFLFKPQPIVVLPVLAAFTFWQLGGLALLRGAVASGATMLAALAPFLLHGDARLIGETYGRMFEQYQLDLTQGAWNGWSILDARGDPHPKDAVMTLAGQDVSYALVSLALCAAATIVALLYLRRHLDMPGLLLSASAMVFAFYMLPTSTHERYLYPLFALAAPLLVRTPSLIPGYAALALAFFLNLVAITPPGDASYWEWRDTNFAIGVAAFNVALYSAFVLWMLWDGALQFVFERTSTPRRRALVIADRKP
jgi:hypothetical protein